MDRRIVIYENNSHTNRGEATFQFVQHVNGKNNILERDIASFILSLEKSNKYSVNAMLVVKYILWTKKRHNPVLELIDYLFHKNDFKPHVNKLPDHVVKSQEVKNEINKSLDALRL